LAQQLGVSLGKIVSFSEGGAPYPVGYAMNASAGGVASAPAPNVPAGENTYSDTVTITYAIH
ncbi:MAG: SIMPL domain-containing protein, partial [Minisyncoccia bacterium]